MRSNGVFGYIRTNLLHPRIFKFAIVGMSGLVVNMGILYFLTEFLNIVYIISSVFAIEISIFTNFLLNDLWTWRERIKKRFLPRCIQYHITAGVTAFLANWLMLIFLTEVIGLYYLISNLIGIGVGMLSNFILNDLWTFGQNDEFRKNE